jgi:hypothetical protein
MGMVNPIRNRRRFGNEYGVGIDGASGGEHDSLGCVVSENYCQDDTRMEIEEIIRIVTSYA